MRIVSWNCHYGLKIEKYLEILSHSPQILIIQECSLSLMINLMINKTKLIHGTVYPTIAPSS
jgi:hypothetical protein